MRTARRELPYRLSPRALLATVLLATLGPACGTLLSPHHSAASEPSASAPSALHSHRSLRRQERHLRPAGEEHPSDQATTHHRFEDIERWAREFEDPSRDLWQLPDSVLSVLVTREDLVVADIGSATGYFPVRFARALPQGSVIGSDIEPGMVMYLNDRARREGLTNLTSVLAGADGPHLPRRVDLVFLCNTYHHINGRVSYFRRLQQELRPGARVAIVDFRPESEKGPPHKLARHVVEDEMTQAGYELLARHTFLPEQYFLVFQVPRE